VSLKPKRRLAAIFVADVFEFSRMMAEDEAGTLARILDQQKNVIGPEIKRHDGRVIKLMGDGVLAVFPSVISAVEAAAAIQRRVNATPEANRLKLRIGLNLGEVMIADRDIYGEGVNVASRIEALALPGGVALSASAYDQLRNKIPYEFEDFGLHKVKNIPDPVRVYFLGKELTSIPKVSITGSAKTGPANRRRRPLLWTSAAVLLLAAVAGGWQLPNLNPWSGLARHDSMARFENERLRVAVRPFTDRGSHTGGKGLAIGLAEGVIADLALVPDLMVIAAHSSLARPEISDQKIAEQLGADYVISGRIERRSGLAVSLDILDLRKIPQTYLGIPPHPQNDVLALQAVVVRDLLEHLPLPDKEAQFAALGRAATGNADAYLQLILARSHLRADRPTEATQALQNALALDPGLGEARGRLAIVHMNLFAGTLSGMEQRIFEARLMLSETVSSRQERLVEIIATLLDYGAEEALVQAEDLVADHPNYADGYATLAWVSICLGRQGGATEALSFAMRLNPIAPAFYHAVEAELLFAAGQDITALAAADRAIAMDPRAQRVRVFRAAALANAGLFDDATAELAILAKRERDLGLKLVAAVLPYADFATTQRVLTGLRLAGLSDDP